MDNDELLVMIKIHFDRQMNEIKQYIDEKVNGQGVLIESLHSDIKTVAEGHDSMNRKISALDDKLIHRMDEIKQEVKGLKSDIAVVKEYIIGVDTKLNEHEIILKRVK